MSAYSGKGVVVEADAGNEDRVLGQDWKTEAWIEQLYREGITAGCATSPLRYCPGQIVNRAEMAAFLTRAFAL